MLQDIHPHIFDNTFIPKIEIKNTDNILFYQDRTVLLGKSNESYFLPTYNDFELSINNHNSLIFLFQLNDKSCFLLNEKTSLKNDKIDFTDINFFRSTHQQEIGWIATVGFHLKNWYSKNKFCGNCGSPTTHKSDERALECKSCKNIIYPSISPAIIVAIISGDKILLARNSMIPGGMYSLIAGYCEVGETLEQTVMREVKEEVGIKVRNIRYYKSQPWALSGSMMVGFVAEADEKEPIIIDKKELSDAAWFSRDKLPLHSLPISIAGEMIAKFTEDSL